MIAHPLYLPDYTLGHMMSHQIRSYMRGKDLAAETKRITSLGCLTPDLWMNRAVASSWGQKVVGSNPASPIFWKGLKPRSDAGFRFLMDEGVPKPRTPARPPLGLVAIDARGRPRLTAHASTRVKAGPSNRVGVVYRALNVARVTEQLIPDVPTSSMAHHSSHLIARATSIPPSWWARLENFAARRQGKGFGMASCAHEVAICASFLSKEPSVVIDVGSNIGDYAVAVEKRFKRATIHTFEPSSKSREKLRTRLGSKPNLRFHSCAISDSRSTAELWSDTDGSALASLSRRELTHFGIEMNHRESVTVERLDHIWPQFESPIVDWIKLDVEGHELAALRGLGDQLKNTRLIQFEFGGCNIDTRTHWLDFWSFFLEAGWKVHRIAPSGAHQIKRYREIDEHFRTTNFVAVNPTLT